MKINRKLVASFLSLAGFFLLQVFNMSFAAGILPDEVQDVVAVPGSGEITLSWSEAEDDGVVVGYKIYYGTQSVQSDDVFYDEELLVSAKTSYTLKGLQNGVEYFFALTAIDDEENESDTYSLEASATPVAESPAVVMAEQVSNSEVLITMSKPVQLQGGTSSFLLEEKGSGRELSILGISADGVKVRISFSEEVLDVGKSYKVIATSLVEDLDGEPIRSGITDTAEFRAQFFEEIAESEDYWAEPVPEPEPESEPEFRPEPVEEVTYEPEEYTVPEPVYTAAPVDTNAPLDATSLGVDSSLLESESIVVLSWQTAPDIEEDIVDQVLYVREGLKGWDDGLSIGKYTSRIEIDVQLDENYEVEIVTVDETGNESDGARYSFTTHLAASGPGGVVIAFLVAVLVGVVFVGGARRRG